MKSRRATALLFLALVITTLSAHAQLGIYANFDATRDSPPNGHTFSGGQSSLWIYGPNLGFYYNFVHLGPLALGFDVRGSYLLGNQYQYRSVLGGVRIAAKAPILPLRPYAQFSVGAGGSKYTGPTTLKTGFSTKFQYMVFGGLDYTIIPHVDLRVAEVGYGQMSGINNTNETGKDSLLTIGTGAVIRF